MDEKQSPPFFDSEEVKKLISAYDRFIPYQILKILGKDRITEISLGDYIELIMNVLFMDAERAISPRWRGRDSPSSKRDSHPDMADGSL
jgi:hypothetical protein